MENETKVKSCFKERFADLRAKSGLSQSKLGKELLLSPATIGYYENGSRLPDIETAARIAQYFDVSADYLLGLSNAKSVEQDMKTACETTGLTQKAIENIQHIFSLFDTGGTSGKAEESIFIDFLESSFFASMMLSFTESVLFKVKAGIVSENASIMQELFAEALEQEIQSSKKASIALEQVKKGEKGLLSEWLDLRVQEEELENTVSTYYNKLLNIMDNYAKRVSEAFVEEIREDYSNEKKRLLKKSFETCGGFSNTISEIDSAIDNKFSNTEQEANNHAQHHTTQE